MDEWLLRWPDGADGYVDVYHNHHWVKEFETEERARHWVTEIKGGVLGN